MGWYSVFLLTFIAPVTLALYKEYHDMYVTKTSKWSWSDVLYTVFPSLFFMLIIISTK
jgi:hypothetical protein